MKIYIDAWSALAPGLESIDSWRNWFEHSGKTTEGELSISLKSIPPMIRRRFRTLGKCAVGSALPLLTEGETISSIFSSRHGDTPLTISLLEDIGRGEPLSPTSFSLAVHNAVSGLFSIARSDICGTTSIAAMESVVLQTICEAIGQLQNADRVLCVIYDVPLPEFFQKYCSGDPFPYAIAMIVSRSGSCAYELEQEEGKPTINDEPEPFALLKMLVGLNNTMSLGTASGAWSLTKALGQ